MIKETLPVNVQKLQSFLMDLNEILDEFYDNGNMSLKGNYRHLLRMSYQIRDKIRRFEIAVKRAAKSQTELFSQFELVNQEKAFEKLFDEDDENLEEWYR